MKIFMQKNKVDFLPQSHERLLLKKYVNSPDSKDSSKSRKKLRYEEELDKSFLHDFLS